MKTLYTKGAYLLLFALLHSSLLKAQNSGIYESYAIIDSGSGNQMYDLWSPTDQTNDVPGYDFQGSNFGTFGTQTGTLILNGGQNNVWKCPTDDITSGWLNYVIYPTGNRPVSPTFTGIDLSTTNVIITGPALCAGGVNQSWNHNNATIDLLNGLSSGDYTLEVFTLADYTTNGNPQTPHFVNNNGNNFTATFRADTPPTASCQDITVYLDATGSATIVASD
ncbi:MAG TPA: hypothetical protein PKI08_10105, partial [Aquaticitalea sp.]|nr:hypothetical protein [Aquaticitalea sp.]